MMERVSTDNWQVSLSDPALTVQDAEDIAQSIYLLIATIPGSDPLRPTFGSGVYRYLDRPLQEVAPRIVYEVTEAIGRWEPRIEVTGCTVTRSAADRAVITVRGNLTGTAQSLTVKTTL